jgi:hypothetical protein
MNDLVYVALDIRKSELKINSSPVWRELFKKRAASVRRNTSGQWAGLNVGRH